MNLHDLIPIDTLYDALEKNLVKVRQHPTLPLEIYNYTEQAQFSRTWNEATLNCRGLIVSTETGDIVARPFKKFFNDQENPRQQAALQQGPVEVTDKLDGSLGIMYPVEGFDSDTTFAIATRGSFVSDQALHATQVFRAKYESEFRPPFGWTLLFEIIYPENRIVVDYGGMDDIVLLGAVNIETGWVAGSESVPGWPGPRAEVFPFKEYDEVLTAPLRPGKEGFVLRWPETGFQLKMKQQDYVELHRIVTGLNERAIWERLARGDDPFEGVPDELQSWVREVAGKLEMAFIDMAARAHEAFLAVEVILQNRGWAGASEHNRKEFALLVDEFNFEPWLRTCLFLIRDKKSIDGFLWKQLRPAGETKRARPGPEDVA